MTDTETTETTETADSETSEETAPKPTDTVDFWKAKAREQEKRAKANAQAASKLAELEDANKSEAQKAADTLAQALQAAETAQAEALRYRIASKHKVTEEDAELFLTGSDEETLTRQAERLAGRDLDRQKQGNHVPREGDTPTSATDDVQRFADHLFGADS